MSDDQYSWFSFLKKIVDFFGYIFSFFSNKKKEEDKEQQDKFDKTNAELKANYEKLDKEAQKRKENDLNKRLNHLF